jgi:hypothetical protein
MLEESNAALEELVRDGLVRVDAGEARTTRRWQAAMARAALRLARQREDLEDLRLPVVAAMLELYAGAPDEVLARRVEAMLPVEAREVFPAGQQPR